MKRALTSFCTASLLAATLGCSSVFYHPDHLMYADQKRMPHAPEDVHFESGDGTKLHGWLFHAVKSPARGLIVHFHGNAQNLTSHFAFLVSAPDEGFDHFIFDYRGYGSSEGKPSPHGMVEDGKAAIRWADQRHLPLTIFAQSLGGAVALKVLIDLHGEVPIQNVVIDSSFANYRSEARAVMGAHWVFWAFQPLAWLIVDNSEAPDKHIAGIEGVRWLVVHGESDHVVAYKLGKRIFAQAKEPKTFWSVPMGVHTDFMFRKSWRDEFYRWLEKDPAGQADGVR